MSTFLKYDGFRGAVWGERERAPKSIGIELVDNANWLPQSSKKVGNFRTSALVREKENITRKNKSTGKRFKIDPNDDN